VEFRRFKNRKDVIGTDPDEMTDIFHFFLICSINKPRLEPKEVKQIDNKEYKFVVASKHERIK
jgi:hypothetical protein